MMASHNIYNTYYYVYSILYCTVVRVCLNAQNRYLHIAYQNWVSCSKCKVNNVTLLYKTSSQMTKAA